MQEKSENFNSLRPILFELCKKKIQGGGQIDPPPAGIGLSLVPKSSNPNVYLSALYLNVCISSCVLSYVALCLVLRSFMCLLSSCLSVYRSLLSSCPSVWVSNIALAACLFVSVIELSACLQVSVIECSVCLIVGSFSCLSV